MKKLLGSIPELVIRNHVWLKKVYGSVHTGDFPRVLHVVFRIPNPPQKPYRSSLDMAVN